MPDPSADRLEEIFNAALALLPADRDALLRERCGDDLRLLERVRRMLDPARTAELSALVDLARRATAFLDEPHGAAPRNGEIIGPYRLLRSIGAGTYGEVFLAEQTEPVRRQVALKIIHAGMNSAEVVRRFRAEQQSLARMDHPNIAKIHDAGVTERGLPYFVMQYVSGEPITDYCDSRRLTIEERLALFATVCEAVEHAHIKSVVHRDLKPSNVLVASSDGGGPEPMIIDFGMAKALGAEDRPETLHRTEAGHALGTWAYMSPEQAAGDPDVDTRSDVYSLGVMLYELLCGSKPFEPDTLKKAAEDELRRLIREVDPPTPSDRLRTSDAAASSATARHTGAAELARRLRRELELIPLFAMRKEPDRRYQRAASLAEDIGRYLAGQALQAAPDSIAYRTRVFIRRNKGVVAATSAIVLTTGIGIASTIAYAMEARFQSGEADTARASAEIESKNARESARVAEERRLAAERSAEESRLARERSEQDSVIANLNAADASIITRDVARARKRLAAIPVERQGWEHRWLSSQSNMSTSSFNVNLDGFIAASGDGRLVVGACADEKVRVWNTETGDVLHVLEGHVGRVTGVDVSVDGRRIATSDTNDEARLWDSESGALIAVLRPVDKQAIEPQKISSTGAFQVTVSSAPPLNAASSPVSRIISTGGISTWVAFSPDGTRLVTTTNDYNAHLWDANTGAKIASLAGHRSTLLAPTFSADGARIVTASLDATARVWDGWTGAPIATLVGHVTGISGAAIDAGGSRVLTTCWDGSTRLWDVASERSVWDLPGGPPVQLTAPGFLPSGSAFYTASKSSVRFYDGRTFETIAEYPIEGLKTFSVTPDETRLLASVQDGSLQVWDLATRKLLATLLGHEREVRSIEIDRESTIAITGSMDGTIRRWNVESFRPQRWTESGWAFGSADPDSSGRFVACAGSSERARIWDLEEARWIASIGSAKGVSLDVAFAPSGEQVAIGYQNGTLELWNIRAKAPVWSVATASKEISVVAFASNGSRVATGDHDRWIRCFDTFNGAQIFERDMGARSIHDLAFDPRGEMIAVGFGSSLVLLDARDGSDRATVRGHEGWIRSVRFSPDGERILTASLDRTARVWTREGKHLMTLVGYVSGVTDARMSPDGTRILTSSGDATVRVWDALSGSELLVLRGASAGPQCAFFLPDQSRVFATAGPELLVWDARSFADPTLDPALVEKGVARLAEARTLRSANRISDAVTAYREAVRLLRGQRAARSELASALSDLGYILGGAISPIREESESVLAEAASLWKALGPSRTQEYFGTLHNRADVLSRLGRSKDAQSLFDEVLEGKRKAFGNDDDEVRITEVRLATVALANGDIERGLAVVDELLARDPKTIRRHIPYLRSSCAALADGLQRNGDEGRALAIRAFTETLPRS